MIARHIEISQRKREIKIQKQLNYLCHYMAAKKAVRNHQPRSENRGKMKELTSSANKYMFRSLSIP